MTGEVGGSLRPPRARRRGARSPGAPRRADGRGSASRSCRGTSASGSWRKPSSDFAREGSRNDIQRSAEGRDAGAGRGRPLEPAPRGTSTSRAGAPSRSASSVSSSTQRRRLVLGEVVGLAERLRAAEEAEDRPAPPTPSRRGASARSPPSGRRTGPPSSIRQRYRSRRRKWSRSPFTIGMRRRVDGKRLVVQASARTSSSARLPHAVVPLALVEGVRRAPAAAGRRSRSRVRGGGSPRARGRPGRC